MIPYITMNSPMPMSTGSPGNSRISAITAVLVVNADRNTEPVGLEFGYESESHADTGGAAALFYMPISIIQVSKLFASIGWISIDPVCTTTPSMPTLRMTPPSRCMIA